jgi:hypothetical protein
MDEARIKGPDLDGWPVFSLAKADVRHVTSEEFRELLSRGEPDGGIYAVETAPGGTVPTQVIEHASHVTGGCRDFLSCYLNRTSFSWEPEYLVLVNEPCYIAVGSSVIFLADGRIISETVMGFAIKTIAWLLGDGLDADNLAAKLHAAPEIGDGVWAPLLSLGSCLYGYAIAQSLPHDSALHRAGLSPLITYATLEWPDPAQEILTIRAHSPLVRFPFPLVRVPRGVFHSQLYRHLPLGTEFVQAIASAKADILCRSAREEPRNDKVYVSRLNAHNRRMINEAELIEHLSRRGFAVVAPDRLPFEEQVRTLAGARLIAGPYGSQLTNAAFAASGAALCEFRALNTTLLSPNLDEFYFALAAAMQLSYGVTVAENAPGTEDWECDITDALDLVDAASAGLGLDSGPPQTRGWAPTPGLEAASAISAGDELDSFSGFWAIPDHTGTDYVATLAHLHHHLQPKTYLEVGTMHGDSLALASCPSTAIDPKFEIDRDIVGHKPACLLFQMKSDPFFQTHDPKELLGGPLEMAFIDGVHLFEFALRDFINVEKHCRYNSIILLHDCIPTDAHLARRAVEDSTLAGRSRYPDCWAGDVWKTVLALREFRPDLRIHSFNAPPTGLVAITSLDPSSELLSKRYFDITARYKDLDLGQYGVNNYIDELKILDTAALSSFESIAQLFWI